MLDNLINQEELEKEPDLPIPSLDQQKMIVAELKRLEALGELTPEILNAFMTGTHDFFKESEA